MTSDPRQALPTPTGPHPVGRSSYDWVDEDRAEIYSSNPSDRRELVVWVWYPAAPASAAEAAPYLPEAWAPVGQMLALETDGLRTSAVGDADVSSDQPRYPVLLLSPSGFPPLLLAATAEELASHGYVVVGVNHTYETAVTVFPDGRTVAANPAAIAGALGPQTGAHDAVFRQRGAVCEYKAADLASVADQLEVLAAAGGALGQRLDLTKLGACGHSFGGNAALEWCRNDARCRAAANLDGALWSEVGRVGLDGPALQILGPHDEFSVPSDVAVKQGMAPDEAWFEAEKAITFGGWRTVADHAQPGSTVRVEGASHLSFMDVPFLPVAAGSPVTAMLAATSIAPERMWRITCDLLLAFFGRHLSGEPAPLLDDPTAVYPEVRVGPP
jgi:hypothetical protein